jgi:cell division protein FtsQ
MRRVSAAPPSRLRRNVRTARLRRIGWRLAVAVIAAATICGGVWFGMSRTGSADRQRVAARLLGASADIGLKVADIRVEGRETTDRETILTALGAGLGTPILAVDPVRARQQLEALPWVRSAAIERRLPDTLIVRLVERKPLALWQHNGKLDLIDRTGSIIPVARLDRFAKLPMVVGDAAAGHAAELLAMLATEPDLATRVTAAVRVADRRWNLQIDNAIDVLLPADQAAGAWAELARVERSSAILKRDVRAIDLRLPDRLVVRLAPAAPMAAPAAKRGRPSAKNT